MKSLKEHILEGILDIEDNLKYSDKVQEEIKYLYDQVQSLKNYNRSSKLPYKNDCEIIVNNLSNLLDFMGYGGDSININFYIYVGNAGWKFHISFLHNSDKNSVAHKFSVEIGDKKISKPSDMIKILKDVTKDVKTFQKFLENIKSNKGFVIDINKLLP